MATKLGRFLLESDVTNKKAGNTITVKTEAEAQKLTGLPKGTVVRTMDTGSFYEDGKKIGTAVNVVAFTLTGSTGYRNVDGREQPWATPQTTAVVLAPGRYLIEGPPVAAQYNSSPWTSEGDLTLPAVVEYTVEKRIYSAYSGVLKITRL